MTHIHVGYKIAHRSIADVWTAVAFRHWVDGKDFTVEDSEYNILATSPKISDFNWNDPTIQRLVMPFLSINRHVASDGTDRFTLFGNSFFHEYQTITDLQSRFQVQARGYNHSVLDPLGLYRPLRDYSDYVSADILRATPDDLAVYRAAASGRKHHKEATEWQG